MWSVPRAAAYHPFMTLAEVLQLPERNLPSAAKLGLSWQYLAYLFVGRTKWDYAYGFSTELGSLNAGERQHHRYFCTAFLCDSGKWLFPHHQVRGLAMITSAKSTGTFSFWLLHSPLLNAHGWPLSALPLNHLTFGSSLWPHSLLPHLLRKWHITWQTGRLGQRGPTCTLSLSTVLTNAPVHLSQSLVEE